MPIQPQEYEALIEKLFDDRLGDEELKRLNDVLRQSPEAREHYWHLVMLEGYLADLPGWIAGQQYATQLAFTETLEAFIEMESNAEAQLQSYPLDTDTPTEREPVTWQDIRTAGIFCIRSLARQKATWGVAAAAMICIVALVYANWLMGRGTQQPSQPIADMDQPAPQVSPVPVEPVILAVVLNQFDQADDSADDNALPPGTELTQGHRLTLKPGSAIQLEYRSGARVILQGPGSFELLSPERIGMQQGRITALVPPQATGFTVCTAQTDFIDHGTEFAIALDEKGRGEVLVFDGLIEARPADDPADLSQQQAEGLMLHEGVGGRLVPNEALPKAVQPIDEAQARQYARNWDEVTYRPRLSGEISYVASPPASLDTGQLTSTVPLLIPERRGVVLAEDLILNANHANRFFAPSPDKAGDPAQAYVIAAGAKLNSFLIHFDITDQPSQGIEREFKIQFSGRIVGIVQMHDYQLKTDALFGLEAMQYPVDAKFRNSADPQGHPNFDYIHVSPDRRTLTVKMRLSGLDQIRVLVENTDS